MKKGFTIVEVSILFVIFLIVALLVAPLSLNEMSQAKNASKWRNVQYEFNNIFDTLNTQNDEENADFTADFNNILKNNIKGEIKPYKITFLNGRYPNIKYKFTDFYSTHSNAVIAVKMLDSSSNNLQGLLMYDVNGEIGPNVWGKDIFGLNLYKDKFEPFCKNENIEDQKQDCSKDGSGLCCSNYLLIGGKID